MTRSRSIPSFPSFIYSHKHYDYIHSHTYNYYNSYIANVWLITSIILEILILFNFSIILQFFGLIIIFLCANIIYSNFLYRYKNSLNGKYVYY